MKRIIAVIVALVVILASFQVNAVWVNSMKCTVYKEDISGSNYQLFISGYGHYDEETDSITMCITNTSEREIDFQVSVGYAGSKVQTCIDSGYVTLKPGVTAEFVLEKLYDIPEKTNDELQYQPDSHLSEKSIVRISAVGVQENDSFVFYGMEAYTSIKNTYFKAFTNSSIQEIGTDIASINDAKKVITEETDDETVFGVTMTQPEDDKVIGFITFVCASVIVGIGGIAVYTVSYILKKKREV